MNYTKSIERLVEFLDASTPNPRLVILLTCTQAVIIMK
jgi:hypothetical protein